MHRVLFNPLQALTISRNLMKLQLNAIKSIGTVNRDQPCVYEAAESRTLSGDTDDDTTASERSNMKYPEMLAIKSSLQPGAHEIDWARYHPEKRMASCRNKCKLMTQICCDDLFDLTRIPSSALPSPFLTLGHHTSLGSHDHQVLFRVEAQYPTVHEKKPVYGIRLCDGWGE